ncbi:MAG: response regulator [Lachnospiraceae bacterium]
MIKIFLVEDEVIIRNGIKNNIRWEEEGFLFAGEASDGELAWPMIRKAKPDILITDIRMPFMDGLELAALVRKELPDTKIIILSGFGEFEYAKKAITLGITEYLLKPISSEKLLEVVKRIADMIRKEQERKSLVERYRKEMEENIFIEKKRLFDRMVIGNCSAGELLEQGASLDIDLTASFYRVLRFRLITSEENREYSDQIVRAMECVNEAVGALEQVIMFESGLEGWIFLVKAESEERMEEETHVLMECLRQTLCAFSQIHYFGGIGQTVRRMRDIRLSDQSASKAFAGRFFTEQDQFIQAEDLAVLARGSGQDMSLRAVDVSNVNRKSVENFLKSGVEEEVCDFVEEYFNSVGKENYRSTMFCHYLIVDMNLCACQFLESRGIDAGQLSQECREVDRFSYYANSTQGMIEYVKQLFTETLQIRDSSARSKYQDLVEQAKEHAAQNFQNNEFSMNQAAAMVNVSPSYFSTLFRQETGKTFVEYLTQLRLEKAKELLMCTDLRSSEIGYQVGYKDPHYFSYIFKKICGCTPKEYRARKNEVPS